MWDNSAYQTNEKLLDDMLVGEFDILEVIMTKFNMTKSDNTKNGCFSQQIRMQPPDILKSIIQNPLASLTSNNNANFN